MGIYMEWDITIKEHLLYIILAIMNTLTGVQGDLKYVEIKFKVYYWEYIRLEDKNSNWAFR